MKEEIQESIAFLIETTRGTGTAEHIAKLEGYILGLEQAIKQSNHHD